MRAHDGRAIPTFLARRSPTARSRLFGDGGADAARSATVSDLIRGLIALAESGHHLPVNIANPDEFTLLELARSVIEVTAPDRRSCTAALPVDDPKQRRRT